MEVIKSKIYVSWSDVETLVEDLCFQIASSGLQITGLYGMPRGGLIPAVMISHRLGIPLIMDETQITETTLIIDDICDTGETFEKFSEKHPLSDFACLYFKPHTSSLKPLFSATTLHTNDWIVYPWEMKNSDTIQDYLKF